MKKSFIEILGGVLAALGLLSFYFLILRLTGMSWDVAWWQFKAIWPWITVLVIGFGVQVGLYLHLRNCHSRSDGKVVAVSGGMSGAAMVACCAHHLIDVLPILGLSAAAIFLVQYQTWFLALGVVSNIFGIGYMVKILKKVKPKLSPQGGY